MQKLLFCLGFVLVITVGVEAQNNFSLDQQPSDVNEKVHYNNHITSAGDIETLLPSFTVSKIIEVSDDVLIKQEDTAIFKARPDGYIRVKKGASNKGVIAQKGAFFRAYIEPSNDGLAQHPVEDLQNSLTFSSKVETVQIKVYPNPFKDRFTIQLKLIKASKVTIELIDPSGRRLQGPLENQLLTKGSNQIEIIGAHLVPGIYHCKIRVGQEEIVKSILRL